jgi:hypothetical protein
MVIPDPVCGQAPLLVMVHCNIFIPNPKFVIVEVGEFTLVTVPLPPITLQVPTPLVGVLPANVVDGELIQTV